MGVVGEQGGAIGGVGAGEGEAVAAGKAFRIARQAGRVACARDQAKGGGAGGGRGPEVEDLLRRQGGQRCGGAVQGGVIGRADRGEKSHAGKTQLVAQGGEGEFIGPGRVLQVERHRIDHEDAVLRPPRPRRGAEHEVLEGFPAEGGEAGVDAGGVTFQQGPLGRRGPGVNLFRELPEAVHPRALIERQRGLAEQLGEFAGPAAAQQVHLEKPVLGMEITQRPGDIRARRPAHPGNPERIARHRHVRAQSGQGRGPVQARQARAHFPVKPPGGHGREQHQHAEHAGQHAEAFPGRGAHRESPRRMPEMICSGVPAMSTTRASAGSSSVASWLSSMAGFMKWPCRPLMRAQSSSRVPLR